jgi:glycosyltransferase involved in cell wall biosynthesis
MIWVEVETRAMHIGFDARLVYYQQAGIGQYIINLLSAFAELEEQRPAAARDRITIFQRGGDELPLAEGEAQTRYNLRTPSHHRFEQPALAWEIGRYHLGHRLDVLHSPDFIQPIWLARLTNLPTVVTIHDLAFLRLAHLTLLTTEAKRYYGQVRAAARTARRIIAVSASTKRDIVELLGVDEAKVTVVHEAANPLFHPVSRQEIRRYITVNLAEKVGEARGFILFVSTIEPRKNLPLLLQAYAALRDSKRTALPNLVVAGREGWLYDEVYDLVRKLGLKEQVIFTGSATAQELLYLYNQAALLACPSFYEGFGLPALEALACGLPVVAANTSSLPEVVGDAGLLLDPHSPNAWTEAMARLLDDDKLRAEMRAKGLQQARQFSWARAAEETLAVYHEATG